MCSRWTSTVRRQESARTYYAIQTHSVVRTWQDFDQARVPPPGNFERNVIAYSLPRFPNTKMLDAVKTYVGDRRKGIAEAAGIAGGLYLVRRYMIDRFQEMQQKLEEERLARERCVVFPLFSIYNPFKKKKTSFLRLWIMHMQPKATVHANPRKHLLDHLNAHDHPSWPNFATNGRRWTYTRTPTTVKKSKRCKATTTTTTTPRTAAIKPSIQCRCCAWPWCALWRNPISGIHVTVHDRTHT